MTRDNLLFAIIGVLLGFIGGFLLAGNISQREAALRANPGPAQVGQQNLPPDHPPVGGDQTTGEGGQQMLATVQTALEQYILQRVKDPKLDAKEGVSLDLTSPSLELSVAGVWVHCSHLSVILYSKKMHYLKYLNPSQYSQLRDHVRGTTLPLHVKLDSVNLRFDDTFVELPEGNVPVFPGLWLEVEESSVIPNRTEMPPESTGTGEVDGGRGAY